MTPLDLMPCYGRTTIRAWSRRTLRWTAFQRVRMPSCHNVVGSCTSLFDHHLLCLLDRFALLSCERRPRGSLPAFAWGDLACLLNPYPLHYRGAFAFSTFLYPHLHRLPSRVAFPMPGEIWACHVSSQCPSGLGPSLFAGSFCVHDRRTKTSCTGSIPFWASLSASLACWPLRRLSGFRIRCPYHSILAPNRVDARSPIVLSRFRQQPFGCGYIVQELHTAALPRPHVLVGYCW